MNFIQIQDYWNSREETETVIIQNHIGQKLKKPSKKQLIR